MNDTPLRNEVLVNAALTIADAYELEEDAEYFNAIKISVDDDNLNEWVRFVNNDMNVKLACDLANASGYNIQSKDIFSDRWPYLMAILVLESNNDACDAFWNAVDGYEATVH